MIQSRDTYQLHEISVFETALLYWAVNETE